MRHFVPWLSVVAVSMQLFVAVLCLVCLPWLVQANMHCVEMEEPVNRARLATKTGYNAAYKDVSLREQFQNEVSGVCGGSAQQVWLLMRHGVRYPLDAECRKMAAFLPVMAEEVVFNHRQGRGCLSAEDVLQLMRFSLPFSLRDAAQLQEEGAEEQYSLGEHWRQLFPDIFSGEFDQRLFKVQVTQANRTGQSAYHFIRGMFGEEAAARMQLPRPSVPDYKLRPYKWCPAWHKGVLDNNATRRQQRFYEAGSEFIAMRRSVSSRLGYMNRISADELAVVYDECRYESAWRPDVHSVWCAVFTQRDIQVLEYHQNLRYYYENSYGASIGPQLACELITDLYQKMEAVVAGTAEQRAALYFSHDKLLQEVLALLGLFRPAQPLRHDNRREQEQQKRGFNISKLTPFSANLGFVLYKCSDGGHRLGGFLHGEPISLEPLCPSTDPLQDPSVGSSGESSHDVPLTCAWPPPAVKDNVGDACNIRKLCNVHDEL